MDVCSLINFPYYHVQIIIHCFNSKVGSRPANSSLDTRAAHSFVAELHQITCIRLVGESRYTNILYKCEPSPPFPVQPSLFQSNPQSLRNKCKSARMHHFARL
jgi:hypothetical protein